ncbi:competence protein ComK [Bacillus sp. CECT 9360]|uniref:competence protein ComK n=1 Tax=Bacillus sp. CECT 9360 TaxID=2845821 RepID=UPI001E2C1F17|nr:competence protein ComK [Bacillus sp. CECT 9360]CAH0343788.1 Competence transcription factor [Bacillus sp. CECT 9360]
MKTVNKHILNHDSSIVAPEFDGYGHENSIVIENDQPFIVRMRPVDLINETIKYYGFSLSGAIEGSRSILGNINMPPIVVIPSSDTIWFPCKSHKHKDCVWLAHAQIADKERVDIARTKVLFKQGHSLIIDLSVNQFERRMQRAAELYLEQIKRKTGRFQEFSMGFNILKDSGNRNYTVHREES